MPCPASFTSLPATALCRVDSLPYKKISSGKVRDLFEVGEFLLLVATDRLSAFDVVLPDGIPGKGIVLTQISLYWFARLASADRPLPNHLADRQEERLEELLGDYPQLRHRSMLVRKLRPLPIEAVVRGALAGSGWKEYRKTGRLFGQEVPEGLTESALLPRPYFTPTTKAAAGHDEPLSLEDCRTLLGASLHEQVVEAALSIFTAGQNTAGARGLILADSKFEFGLDETGRLHLIDEVLTPDSSRYWPAGEYVPGRPQYAYDKQYVRDYLETLPWPKTHPGPNLPAEVIRATQERYVELWRILTGG